MEQIWGVLPLMLVSFVFGYLLGRLHNDHALHNARGVNRKTTQFFKYAPPTPPTQRTKRKEG